MAFTYRTNKDFEIVKNEILNLFESSTAHKTKGDKLIFNNRYYSICVFNEPEGDIYIEVERIDASIKGLRYKIKEIIDKIEILVDKNIINNLRSCKLEIELPFKRKIINLRNPKGFDIKDISIKMQDLDNHTIVKINMDNTLSMKFNKLTLIEDIIKKLLY